MSNEVPNTAKAWREEVDHLFGISWDRFIEWVLIGWLSAWIWTAWIVSNAFIVPRSGPITWIADVIRSFGGEPAAWLVAIPTWLMDPARAALLPITVVLSAVAATLSLRSHKLTGLRVLALAAACVAVEVEGSMWPLLWIVLIAAIPAAAAFVAGLLPTERDHDEREWAFFYSKGTVEMFLARVVGLFVMPVVAPLVLLAALLFSYRLEREYRPADALGTVTARELNRASNEGKTVATSDPLLTVAAIVAAITSTSELPNSRAVAATFDFHVRHRREM